MKTNLAVGMIKRLFSKVDEEDTIDNIKATISK
jgi:hypothetical protein